VAAPIWKNIAEATLRQLGVPRTINPIPPPLIRSAGSGNDTPAVKAPETAGVGGGMETCFGHAGRALDAMVNLGATSSPGAETTAAMLTRRTMLVNALLAFASKALEVGGGAGF